jgi:hypothetical protein
MQKNSVYNTLWKSLFYLFAWLTRATPSLINLQIREKKYDFHN